MGQGSYIKVIFRMFVIFRFARLSKKTDGIAQPSETNRDNWIPVLDTEASSSRRFRRTNERHENSQ